MVRTWFNYSVRIYKNSAFRTPIGKAPRGVFKDTHPVDLLVPVIKALLEKTKIDPNLIDDVCVGNVNMFGAGATHFRMAAYLAGLPERTSVCAVNRQCSSGIQVSFFTKYRYCKWLVPMQFEPHFFCWLTSFRQ